MRLAFTYLHGWLIFCGFHASKYTIQGSYVIYLPTIYLQFIYINSDIHLFSSQWQMFHWACEFGLTFRLKELLAEAHHLWLQIAPVSDGGLEKIYDHSAEIDHFRTLN